LVLLETWKRDQRVQGAVTEKIACDFLDALEAEGYSMSGIIIAVAAMSWDALRNPHSYGCLYGGKLRQKTRAIGKRIGRTPVGAKKGFTEEQLTEVAAVTRACTGPLMGAR
jgi:hypothetical protein